MIPPLIAQISHQEQMEKEAATKSKRAVSTLAKSPLELSPVTFLAKPNSGIARPFWDKPELLEEFIRLHELFIRIASLIELLNKAYALSGEGGNILIYGFARKQMASLVVDYTLLSNAVRDSVFIIEQHADGLYQHLVRENLPSYATWKLNYIQVSEISILLAEDLDKGHQAANRVREQATSYALTLRSRIDRKSTRLNSSHPSISRMPSSA